jgi:DNA-directed RNA polymerase specialized sigma24 family protein
MCSRTPGFTDDKIHVRLLGQTAPPDNVVGWLYVVTRRISNRQRLRTLTRRSVESSYRSAVCTRADPDLLLDARSILERLPPRDRRLLLLVVEGMGSTEIAQEFACSVRDIGQMVARARRKARRLLLNQNDIKKR